MKKNKFYKNTTGLLILIAMSIMTACGKNSGGNNNPVPVQQGYVFQQCVNCQTLNGPVLFTAVSTDFLTNLINLNWSFNGQAGSAYYTPGTYNGAVTANGQMTVSQSTNLGYCQIPAGAYTLATIQPGQWIFGGGVSGLGLQAISGASNLLMIFSGTVSSPGYLQDGQLSSATNPVGRMTGVLQVQSINGYACQATINLQ